MPLALRRSVATLADEPVLGKDVPVLIAKLEQPADACGGGIITLLHGLFIGGRRGRIVGESGLSKNCLGQEDRGGAHLT